MVTGRRANRLISLHTTSNIRSDHISLRILHREQKGRVEPDRDADHLSWKNVTSFYKHCSVTSKNGVANFNIMYLVL